MSMLSQRSKIVQGRAKRLGRGLGSGKGVKSGRGTTRHQGARTTIPLHFEGGQGRLVKKFPLLRGKMKNKSVQAKPFLVSLTKLNVFDDGAVVTVESLITGNVVPASARERGVKVLANGKLEKKITLEVPHSAGVAKLLKK